MSKIVVNDSGAFAKPRAMELRIVVTRADGTVEDYGVVAAMHRNPIINLWRQIAIRVRRWRNDRRFRRDLQA